MSDDWMDRAAYVRQFPVGQEPTAREIDEAVTRRKRVAKKKVKPIVYVSVYGGIADADVYPKELRDAVEIIHIDWDEYEDNLADVDNVISDIEDTKRLFEAGYEGAWLDMDRALDRSGGTDLEQYTDEEAAMIIDALEQAGHPYQLSENGRQIPLLDDI